MLYELRGDGSPDCPAEQRSASFRSLLRHAELAKYLGVKRSRSWLGNRKGGGGRASRPSGRGLCTTGGTTVLHPSSVVICLEVPGAIYIKK